MSELDPMFRHSNPYLDDPDSAEAWTQLVAADRGFNMLCKADEIRETIAGAPELLAETVMMTNGWSDLANPHCVRLVEHSFQKARATMLTKYGEWLLRRTID